MTAPPAAGVGVSLSGSSLVAGQTCVIAVNVTSVTVAALIDIIPPGVIVTAEGESKASEARTLRKTRTNLGVVRTFSPVVIGAGGRGRLTVTLTNPGPTDIANLTVTDTVPPA